MTWLKHHSKSEEYAGKAEIAAKAGKTSLALKHYKRAAKEEEVALSLLDPEKKRTLGITSVSVVALWFKSNDLKKAEGSIYKYLSTLSLPNFAVVQLKAILQKIWNEQDYDEPFRGIIPMLELKAEKKSWNTVSTIYAQIVDLNLEQKLVRLICKMEEYSTETFERTLPLTFFKHVEALSIDQCFLINILEKPGVMKQIIEETEVNYFVREEQEIEIDLSTLADSPIFKVS